LETVLTFSTRAKAMGRQAFLSAHSHPFFLIEPFMAPDDTGFKTVVGVKNAAGEELVAAVAKREGANKFGHMITIGRASNNDVCIRYQNVSKFHGYAVELADGRLGLVDAASTNGTEVGGELLEPRAAPRPLDSGDKLRFADLEVVFYSPADLYDLVLSA
jgi:hypothetical protein